MREELTTKQAAEFEERLDKLILRKAEILYRTKVMRRDLKLLEIELKEVDWEIGKCRYWLNPRQEDK